jgi:hypothetical protein
MPQKLFVTDGCLIDYEMPFVLRVTHLETAQSARFLVHLNREFPERPEKLSAFVVSHHPIADQDGKLFDNEVANQMRAAVLRSIQEQGFNVELLMYNHQKEIYVASLKKTLEGAEKAACLKHLEFLDAVHRDELTKGLLKIKDKSPTDLEDLSDLWDDIAWTYGKWRGITWPSPPPEKWRIPARYRTEPKRPDDLTIGIDSITRVASTTEAFIRRDPKRIIFTSEYPIKLWFVFQEYDSEIDPQQFSLYTRQQFGCPDTRGQVSSKKRPLHESLEMHDPVPPHVREWVEGNLRQAFPECRISINWLNPDDKVPLYRVGDTDFQVSGDGVYEAPWGWRLTVDQSGGPERGVYIECYDRTRKAYIKLEYYRDQRRPQIDIPSTWSNSDVLTDEHYRNLETFLQWACSEARVVRQADIERR